MLFITTHNAADAILRTVGLEDCNCIGAIRQKSWKACRLELVHQRGCEDVLNGEELQGSDPCSNREVNSS